jgi:tape measure domain-containing protein
MSETHSVNLNINATGAKRGASEYKTAINQITTATKAYKTALGRLDKAGGKVDFSRVARELSSIGRLRLNPTLASDIAQLGSSLRSFRAPTNQQLTNTRDFLRSISAAHVDGATARNIAAVNAAFVGFKGPSAAATRNIGTLVDHLNRLHKPANLASLAATLNGIAAAGSHSNSSLSRLSGTHGKHSAAMRSSQASAVAMSDSMGGLANSFSLTAQAGAALSGLFSALTFTAFVRGVYDATSALDRFANVAAVTNPNLAHTTKEMAFATGVADRYGMSLGAIQDSFGKFATSARLAGQSSQNTQYIFESMSSAMRVLGSTSDGQRRVFLALSQMFSKGTISAEELRQQLGEELPGAFELMQQALSEHLGKPIDLSKMLANGEIDSSAVLLLAKKVSDTFGGQVANAMERADAKVARLSNSWTKFQQVVGKSDVQDALGDVAKRLSDIMESADFQKNAVVIAEYLATAIRSTGDAAAWALTHLKEIGSVAATLGTAMGVSSGLKFAGMLKGVVSAASGVGRAFGGLPLLIGGAAGALVYFWNELIKVGDQSATVGQIATQTFYEIASFAGDAWDSISTLNFDGLISTVNDFALAAGSAFGLVSLSADENARLTASSWVKAFRLSMASAQSFGTMVMKSALQLGSAAKNYTGYQIKSLFGGDDKALWEEFIRTTKGEFDYLEDAAAQTYHDIVKDWNLSRDDVTGGLATELVRRAKELSFQRELLAREAAKQSKTATNNNNPLTPPPDFSTIDPLKDGKADADAKDSVSKRLKDAAEATANYRAEAGALFQQLRAGAISLDQYNVAIEHQTRKLQDSTDPYAAMVRAMREEKNLLRMSSEAQQQERAFRESRNQLLEEGVSLTDQQTDALRRLIAEQQRLSQSNPFRDYVDGIQDFGRATDDIAVKAIDGLADQIASAVATGKADFASLAQSILSMFIKSRLQSLFKRFWADAFGGEKSAAEQAASSPASSIAAAGAALANDNFRDVALRGAFPVTGDPRIATTETGRRALQMSDMNLRGGLDLLTNPTGATVPFDASAKTLTVTAQEVTDLKKTLMTEVSAGLKDTTYDAQASGIVDTILNRKVSGKWGDTVTSVVNARKQFSDINGPVSWKDGRHSVGDIANSDLLSGRGLRASRFVDDYLAKRAAGAPSSVGGHLNYANPNYSDEKNLGWINRLDGPVLGAGKSIHKHGTTAGLNPVDPNYAVKLAGQQQSIDPQVTGSIQQVNTSLQALGTTAQQTAQQQTTFAQQASVAHQVSGQAVLQSSLNAQMAGPNFTQAGQAIAAAGQQAGQGAQAAGQGLGQLTSLLGSIPGAGQYVGMINQLGGLFGLFEEGGLATAPVAMGNMPHFAEGTANTGSYGRGGIPSVLHPNEAVIPLSRGRAVPVEMNTRGIVRQPRNLLLQKVDRRRSTCTCMA